MSKVRSNKPIIVLLSLVLLALAGSATWLMWQSLRPVEARQDPTVVEVLPDARGAVSRAATVELVFDQKMDHASVEAALIVEPAFVYDVAWRDEGPGERLILTPQRALEWDTTYRVALDASARNRAGRPLAAAVESRFHTGSEVRVLAVEPAQGADGVDPTQPVTVRFDRPLVEVASLEEQEGLPQPVAIEPAVPGVGRWLAPDLYGFYPDEGLTAGTEYQVTVGPLVAPALELDEPITWRFTTEGPRLAATYPFDGASEVERATSVTLLFNQPMERASVEGNFRLHPEGMETPVAGAFVWEGDERLIFQPREPLALATDYQIEVGEGARAQGGARGLAAPYRAVFSTVDFLAVESVQPAPGSAEVSVAPTDTLISLQFNHPVVSLVGLAEQRALPSPIRLSPSLPGEGEWVTTSLFVYRPSAPLAPSTEYVVTVEANLQDTLGSFMSEPYSWSFATEFPRVVRLEPSNPRRLVAPAGPIALRFNQPMDPTSTEAAFTLEGAGGDAVPGRFAWEEEGTLLQFFPAAPLVREAEYRVVLAAGARGARGGQTDESFEQQVVAAPLPRVVRTLPEPGAEGASPFDSIQIVFNTPIATDDLLSHVTIVPTATQVYTYYDPETLTLNLSAAGPLQPSTEYTVTLDETLRDESGQPLGEPYSFSFTTAPLPPELELIRPGSLVGTYNPYTTTLQVVRHRNISGMDWQLFRVAREDLIAFLGTEAYERWEGYQGDPEALVASWQVEVETDPNVAYLYKTELPPEENASLETTLEEPLRSGIYLLRVTAPERNPWDNSPLVSKQLMVFTPVNLTIKRAPDEVLVWATDVQSGEPVAGLDVDLFNHQGEPLGEGRTDEVGLFRAPLVVEEGAMDPYAPVIALSSAEGEVNGLVSTDWDQGINPFEWGINASYAPQTLYGTLYTDRPLYRPGQTVFFKGVLRQRDGSALLLPDVSELELAISYQGEPLETRAVTLSPFGTFHGEFVLDEEASTGSYEMILSQQQIGQCYGAAPDNCYWETIYGSFQVAEYQRPEFEVSVEVEQPSVVQGEPARAAVAARYYFGGALADAPYTWRLTARDFFFSSDAVSGYWSWQDQDDWFAEAGFASGEVLREGEGTLDESGRATLTVPTSLERGEAPPRSQVLTVEADVRDVNDAIITGRDELVVHAGEFYIGLSQDVFLGNVSRPFTLTLATADPTGALIGGQAVTVEFYRREWYSVRETTEGGGLAWTTAFTDTLAATRPAVTGADGLTRVAFEPEQGGFYTALARGEDSQGHEVRSRTFFWIASEAFVAWQRENNDRIELVADKETYEVGDVARVLVPTPFEGMTALVTEEGLTIGSATVRVLAGTAEVLEIPITEAMIPNAVISVVAVTGMSEQTPLPEYRVGNVSLRVLPTAKTLHIAIAPQPADGAAADGEPFEPGQTASVALQVTDAAGTPVQAELSLAVVDQAILALGGAQPLSLEEAFYAERPLAVRTASSFVVNVDRLSQQLATEAKGGGGAEAARFGPEAVRSQFVDTAFWRADIVTDAQGRAEVQFPLPDNLTTWVLTAQAVTAEGTRVGSERAELLTTRPLLVRPTLPRFFVVGDRAALRVPINNNSEQPVEATVTWEAEGLRLRDGAAASAQVTVPAGGSTVVTFPVEVLPGDAARVTVRAEGGGLADGVQRTLPVYPVSAPETVATGGVVREGEGAAVETLRVPEGADPTQGALTVELAPSLAGATEGALGWLETYPYESTEWVASTLLANVATARAIEQAGFEPPAWLGDLREEVSTGVQKLLAWQNNDGGWGWWRGDASQPWLSGYVLLGLHEARDAGFEAPEERLARATRYVERWLGRTADLQDDATLDTRAFLLYVLAETGNGDASRAAALFDQHSLLNTDGKAFLLLALAHAGEAQQPQVQTLASELTARARLSATGAHWEEAALDPWALDSSLRTTAVVLRALGQVQPEHMLLPQAVRWLMHARQSGHWQSTQATAWAVLALTDFMLASGELEADFAYEVALNDEVVLSERATAENLAEPVTLRVAVAELLLDEENRLLITRTAPSGGQSGAGRLYYSAWLQSFLPGETLDARFQGISVARQYEAVDAATLQSTGAPVASAAVGDLVQVRLTVSAPNDLYFFTLEDPIPAGFEVVDPTLLTTSTAAEGPTQARTDAPRSPFWYDGWSQSVIRDEKVALFSDLLPRGAYEYTYLLRATVPGEFTALPAHAYEHYHPEVFGRSEGGQVTVTLAAE